MTSDQYRTTVCKVWLPLSYLTFQRLDYFFDGSLTNKSKANK